jgi:hypothetical protein
VNGSERDESFWRTLPGILSAVATVVTALTGLIIGLNQAGLFSADGQDASTQPNAASSIERPRPQRQTANAVAGTWSGKFHQDRTRSYELQLTIAKGCTVKATCGSVSSSQVPCFGDLSFKGVEGERYEFSVDHFSATSGKSCTPGAGEYLTPHGDDALLYTTGYDPSVRGILRPPR